jgi:hypothetical protein
MSSGINQPGRETVPTSVGRPPWGSCDASVFGFHLASNTTSSHHDLAFAAAARGVVLSIHVRRVLSTYDRGSTGHSRVQTHHPIMVRVHLPIDRKVSQNTTSLPARGSVTRDCRERSSIRVSFAVLSKELIIDPLVEAFKEINQSRASSGRAPNGRKLPSNQLSEIISVLTYDGRVCRLGFSLILRFKPSCSRPNSSSHTKTNSALKSSETRA